MEQNTKAIGSQLINNLFTAHLSNVKNSLYLIDETNCSSKAFRDLIINYGIEQLIQSKIYGNVIYLSMRNIKDLKFLNDDYSAKYSHQALYQNIAKIGDVEYHTLMASGQSIPKRESISIPKLDNLILLNAYPLLINPPGIGGLGKPSNIYQILKQSEKPYETLLKIINIIISSQKLGQAALVIDSLQLFEKLGKPSDLLNFFGQVQRSIESSSIFPVYVHSDFSLVRNKQLQLALTKSCNGYLRIEKESSGVQKNNTSNKYKYALVYVSVVKPGERFTDETSVVQYSLLDYEMKLLGNKEDVMKHFSDGKKQSQEEKPSNVKATFKIEINDEDKKVRDSSNTTLYHTGNSNQGGIQLDQEDLDELEKKRLEDIEEGEGGEDDDEEEEDDPDEDLDF
ncbi:UNKNOWN [Stylonychia lemnae]|uniref:Elongator complex protein 5 n=1 Tax=Stylonychia lemnae TaxID=5949 RepID=A0A078AYV4_STYLE|nr:UNKNOWN [Stylonychia lemnae]|eukprot:CDW85968.1 UNKNOWN [Stylonychia lemnae]